MRQSYTTATLYPIYVQLPIRMFPYALVHVNINVEYSGYVSKGLYGKVPWISCVLAKGQGPKY